jgi:glycerophosphoryl diester phosphodiesterase
MEQLSAIQLRASGECIPSLAAVLDLIAGSVPLLIEVLGGTLVVAALSDAVRHNLEGYCGPAGIMSFNPWVGRWFAANAPEILRGLVVTEEDRHGLRSRIARQVALGLSRPDFLAYDIRDLPSAFAASARSKGIKVLTWTVRSQQQHATAARFADQVIYEAAP